MGDPTKNQDKVLTQAALQKQGAIDPDFLARQSKWLITLLTWITKGPPFMGKYALFGENFLDIPPLKAVAGYLNYYKIHLVVLARVLASIKKAEPIGNLIKVLEDNISGYVKETSEVTDRVMREIPASPWRNVNPGPVIILLAPSLKQDQRFVQEWNTYLNVYQALTQAGVEVTGFLAEQGRDTERTTPQKIAELRDEVKKIKESIGLDIVIKRRYDERVDWVYLNLTKQVQPARRAAEEAGSFLQKALIEAQKAQRL